MAAKRAAFEEQAGRSRCARGRTRSARQGLIEISNARTELEARMQEQNRAHEDKVTALTTLRGEIEKNMRSIAGDSLQQSEEAFLVLANEVFEKHKVLAGSLPLANLSM